MHNLYFFRHVMREEVLVAPYFRIALKKNIRAQFDLLRQINQHHQSNQIRWDHWTPFAVLTGIRSPETVKAIQSEIFRLRENKKRSPDPVWKIERHNKEQYPWKEEWTVPDKIKKKMVDLCKVLTTNEVVQAEVEGILAAAEKQLVGGAAGVEVNGEGAKEDGSGEGAVTTTSSGEGSLVGNANIDLGLAYQLWFERDDFRQVVEEEGLLWPVFVDLQKLTLEKGHYPIVPGFDPKAMRDLPETVRGLWPAKYRPPITTKYVRKLLANKGHRDQPFSKRGVYMDQNGEYVWND
ncbi:hypothetical protein HDV00_009206 [Rhizophlyctis rosea]|nr:hypothetical protein HDV00_009206 [Rhizophlyctis rosea]